MMIIPKRVEVLHPVQPWTNVGIIAICILFFILTIGTTAFDEALPRYIGEGFTMVGAVWGLFLHGGWMHLIFNMVFLWVFGNAVCAKFGNVKYAILFLVCGLAATFLHQFIEGGPVIGASGAINGIIGYYLVLYPRNRIHCYFIYFVWIRNIELRGKWLIGFWFIMDIWGTVGGEGSGVAYWAHVGGFLMGFIAGILSLKLKWIEMSEFDNPTLLGSD